jgi:hypothetical protein
MPVGGIPPPPPAPPPAPPSSEWAPAALPLSITAPEPEPEQGYLGALSGRWCTNDVGTALAETAEIILDLPADSRVQIASDLHLEFIRVGCGAEFDLDAVVTPAAPILALLGDIGIPTHPGYKRFLLHQAERFDAVLVLTGNHEFYDSKPPGPPPQPRDGETWAAVEARHQARPRHGVEDMEQVIESLCDLHPALHYVDNRVVRLGHEVDAPALICTPLWSHIPRAAMSHVGRCLNDYTMAFTRIADGSAVGETAPRNAEGQGLRRLTPEDTSNYHSLAVDWLRREIARLRGDCPAIAVMSHHTPAMVGTSHPRFEGQNADATMHAFSTDLSDVFAAVAEVKVWAYGHTHFNNDRFVDGTRLLSNQRGYQHEVNGDYRPDLSFSLCG